MAKVFALCSLQRYTFCQLWFALLPGHNFRKPL
jgi:hypothetical protein